MPAFIETQFPIARLSAEAYKERKANYGQTLTRLGKWWGRKPLILVRAAIIGMLMPASDDPKLDREIFLKILTMDDDGAWQRRQRGIKRKMDRATFDSTPYAERIRHCERPENVTGPTAAAWAMINAHLGTSAKALPELVQQLSERAYGHTVRVGDCFCGGGSIPFEAARIGCEAYGSDLNPVASLLAWASLNLLGGGLEAQKEVTAAQAEILVAADAQVRDWGIEHNEQGERADAYIYCVEVKPEGCDYYIPLAPSWLVGEKSKVIVRWHRVPGSDRLQPDVVTVSDAELKLYKAKKGATVINSRVIDPFDPARSWSIEALRGPGGLRRWTKDDVIPRPEDVFQERLYCIRWVKEVRHADGKATELRRYAAPEAADVAREAKVLDLLHERFEEWQREGYIPSKPIIPGHNTDQPMRERGWTHWHHLFTPRQLLTQGIVSKHGAQLGKTKRTCAASMLGIGRLADWNARLSAWMFHAGNEKGNQVFYNQALNCHLNYAARPLTKLAETYRITNTATWATFVGTHVIDTADARDLRQERDLWITDPPYADAVNYHELGDFFLAWYDKQLMKSFPEWIPDPRSDLAVRGQGDEFRRSMVEIYKNLAAHMPDNGMQMVMFTHQNPAVWADLGMILWAAGLRATAAWTISTETEAVGIKKGNYVQGTVCLVLRKRTTNEPGFLDEVHPLVEDEVRQQIDFMQAVDEDGEPNFNDADYQLAAYAAALKVLTQYATLDGRDVEHEVFAVRAKNQMSDFQAVIERALNIACNLLVPRGLEGAWRDLTQVERYYLRALDIESRGERRQGMYEELARGFGVHDIKPLLRSDKANGAQVHTASGLANSALANAAEDGHTATLPARRGRASVSGPHAFASSPLRHLLFAVRETAVNESPEPGRQYLRDTFSHSYWNRRERFIHLLDWLAALGNAEEMVEWKIDSEAARLLAGRLKNDEA